MRLFPRILGCERIARLRRKLTGKVSSDEVEIRINEALRVTKNHQLLNRERAVREMTVLNFLRAERQSALVEIRRIERQLKKNGINSAELAVEMGALQQKAESLIPRIQEAESVVAVIKRDVREEEDRFRKATTRAVAAASLIQAEACIANLKHLLTEAEREYGGLKSESGQSCPTDSR